MRPFAHACALAVFILAASAGIRAAPASASSRLEPQRSLIVVTFSNEPYLPPARAGATGQRWAGGGYVLAQRAHDKAQRVATAYSLRQVRSWPIKALAVYCVVYEILDDRPVSAVLTALAKDPRVAHAQPLQEFHTLSQRWLHK